VADHVLCVVSDDYLKAPYSTLERNAALWQAAAKRPGFVLLVAVRPCRLPTLSDHVRRCELFGIPEDAARLRFREFMQKREALLATAFGLVAAIPAVVIYNHLARVIAGYRTLLGDASAQLLLLISRGQRSHAAAMSHAAE